MVYERPCRGGSRTALVPRYARSCQAHLRSLPERVGDLGYFVDLVYQGLEPVFGGVALQFDLVEDLVRDHGLAREVSGHFYPDALQPDADRPGLAEEVVGDAPGHREVQQLPAAEAEPSAPTLGGPIHHQRELLGRAERGDSAIDVPGLHFDVHARTPHPFRTRCDLGGYMVAKPTGARCWTTRSPQ